MRRLDNRKIICLPRLNPSLACNLHNFLHTDTFTEWSGVVISCNLHNFLHTYTFTEWSGVVIFVFNTLRRICETYLAQSDVFLDYFYLLCALYLHDLRHFWLHFFAIAEILNNCTICRRSEEIFCQSVVYNVCILNHHFLLRLGITILVKRPCWFELITLVLL